MLATLRAFLREIIDYAGVFPPAELSLEQALRNYAAYRTQPQGWLLGRFVCPARRLGELEALRDLFGATGPPPGGNGSSPAASLLRVVAVGRGGDDAAGFLSCLDVELAQIAAFHGAWSGRGQVEAFECRLPDGLLRDECTAELIRLLESARGKFAQAGLSHVPLFCEPPLAAAEGGNSGAAGGLATDPPGCGVAGRDAGPADGTAWPMLDVAIGALAFFNTRLTLEKRGTPADRVGLKLRCGGAQARQYPSSELVARVIERCVAADVPLKFTAGLHHAIRQFDPQVRAMAHGFVNLFAAGVLAWAVRLEEHDLRAVLDEQDAREFEFSEAFFGWNDAQASVAEIEHVRAQRVLSFGSCSFDEPCAELRALGWLNASGAAR